MLQVLYIIAYTIARSLLYLFHVIGMEDLGQQITPMLEHVKELAADMDNVNDMLNQASQ